WTRSPVNTPTEFLTRMAVRSFLEGRDPYPEMEEKGVPRFVAKRMIKRARDFLNEERFKRRARADEILRSRNPEGPTFTSENFRVTVDTTHYRDYGMVNTSIYCMVEVWVDDQEIEKEYLVNFSDYKTKEWLTRLL